MFRALAAIVLGLLFTSASCRAADLPATTCYPDWSNAAPVVRQERLITIEQLRDIIRARMGSELVTAKLCREAGRFVYQVLVRTRSGSIRSLTVDASRPFQP